MKPRSLWGAIGGKFQRLGGGLYPQAPPPRTVTALGPLIWPTSFPYL